MRATLKRAARGQREVGGDVERVGRVEPDIGRGTAQIDRREIARRLLDQHAGAGHEQIGIDRAELAVAVEMHAAVVEAGADDDMIAVVGDLRRIGRLQRAAEAVRRGPGAVDLAEIGAVDVGNLVAGGIEQRRHGVAVAQQARRRAGLRVRGVAVDVALAEVAEIGVGLQRQSVGRLVVGAGLQEGELVTGALRPGVDARPAPVQHFERRRRHRAEPVVRAGEGEVKFGPIAAGADVEIDAPQARRRGEIPPAVIVGRVGRDIGGDIVLAAAGLDGGADAAVRAAADLALGAPIVEAVLHLDRDRAAERVEAVDRIARRQRHAVDGVLGDEVPVHGVAEHLVDAGAVLIDGDALGRARHRRRGEAAIIEVGLERIAGLVAARDAGQGPDHRIGEARRDGVIEIGGRNRLDVRRNLIALDVRSR